MGNSRGQNVVEYILLVAAALIVCIVFYANPAGGPMGQALNASLNGMINMVNTLNAEIHIQ